MNLRLPKGMIYVYLEERPIPLVDEVLSRKPAPLVPFLPNFDILEESFHLFVPYCTSLKLFGNLSKWLFKKKIHFYTHIVT